MVLKSEDRSFGNFGGCYFCIFCESMGVMGP